MARTLRGLVVVSLRLCCNSPGPIRPLRFVAASVNLFEGPGLPARLRLEGRWAHRDAESLDGKNCLWSPVPP